ncbi:MAG: 3-deoxy-manno-octulosonate cytidylyltransferase [Calditrichaeota bacterium]|nr:3-deoxy-manno-octulosonate cytidylyltransferase [Calditrichota bacterium]
MNQKVIGVIPARYGSSRFPGKIIAEISGKPMIRRVYEQVKKSKLLDDLIVAVDDERVRKVVEGFGGNAVMTDSQHQSGTDRIAEVMEKHDCDIVVNIQGDQPLLDPNMIDEAVLPLLDDETIPMSTIKTAIGAEGYNDPGVVKVVTDVNGFALYFSRSLIPFPRDKKNNTVFEHVGLYVYRRNFLLKISKMQPSSLERMEMLEQLRVLENGYKILVVETKSDRAAGVSVDTPEDLANVEKMIQTLSS